MVLTVPSQAAKNSCASSTSSTETAGGAGRAGGERWPDSFTGLTAVRSSSTTTKSLNEVWHFAQVTRTIHADSSLPSTRMSDRE